MRRIKQDKPAKQQADWDEHQGRTNWNTARTVSCGRSPQSMALVGRAGRSLGATGTNSLDALAEGV